MSSRKLPKLTLEGYVIDWLEISLTDDEKIVVYKKEKLTIIEFYKKNVMSDVWRAGSNESVVIRDDDGVYIAITQDTEKSSMTGYSYIAKKYVYYPEHRVIRVVNSLPEI